MPKEVKSRVQKTSKKQAAEKPTRKRRAKKDPNAPKKGMSPFLLFSQDTRPRLKSENPDATFGDLGKLLGVAWKQLPDNKKNKYTQAAEKDKERYEREMKAYKARAESEGDEEEEESD